jgi:glutathione synthase/RimK-type ligase-like ATP-grasp enzyme
MTGKTILIASCPSDSEVVQPVADILTNHGYTIILYDSLAVAKGETDISISIDKAGKATIIYNKITYDFTKIVAGWYRRPSDFGLDNDPLRAYSLNKQYIETQDFLWRSIQEERWLNAPWNIRAANNKLLPLLLAKQLGFSIPPTVASNTWAHITKLPGKYLSFKMPSIGFFYGENGKVRLSNTKIIENNKELLEKNTLIPYPGIWQPFIEKKREWRITVVGEKVFSAAIYTDEKAKDDWRIHQFTKGLVTFKKEEFPKDLQQKCIAFLKHYNLKFGAFDFIETPDGEIVFLECNPNGQYGWLEEELELPISEAIAQQLITIAQSR